MENNSSPHTAIHKGRLLIILLFAVVLFAVYETDYYSIQGILSNLLSGGVLIGFIAAIFGMAMLFMIFFSRGNATNNNAFANSHNFNNRAGNFDGVVSNTSVGNSGGVVSNKNNTAENTEIKQLETEIQRIVGIISKVLNEINDQIDRCKLLMINNSKLFSDRINTLEKILSQLSSKANSSDVSTSSPFTTLISVVENAIKSCEKNNKTSTNFSANIINEWVNKQKEITELLTIAKQLSIIKIYSNRSSPEEYLSAGKKFIQTANTLFEKFNVWSEAVNTASKQKQIEFENATSEYERVIKRISNAGI